MGKRLIGTGVTDENGIATVGYVGKGSGVLNIQASVDDGSLLSETYSIEDCYYYAPTEQTITNSSTTVYTAMCTGLETLMSNNFSLEFDILNSSGIGGGLNIGAKSQYTPPSTANYRIFIGLDSGKFNCNNRSISSFHTEGPSYSNNTYYSMKLLKQGGTFNAYVNNTQFATKTPSWINNYNQYDLYFIGWSSCNVKIKNIKVKAL